MVLFLYEDELDKTPKTGCYFPQTFFYLLVALAKRMSEKCSCGVLACLIYVQELGENRGKES
jgi:hypothetical protein